MKRSLRKSKCPARSRLGLSNRRKPFDPTGVEFCGVPVKQCDSAKIVGFHFDSKLSWAKMVAERAKKGRQRLAMLRRLTRFLDSSNLELMYTAFIRPVLEYGSLLYMSAADSHLSKLDKVQSSAEALGGFKVPSLQLRRDVATVTFALKLLDGAVKPLLNKLCPTIVEQPGKRGRSGGIQIESVISTYSLDKHRKSFFGVLPSIWCKLPQYIIADGKKSGWRKIKARVKKALVYNNEMNNHVVKLNIT